MPDELLMRQVPQDLTAEQSLLGAMLVDPNCIPEVIEQVRADDFYAEENKRIFETIYSMFNGAQRIDPVTVLDMLTRMGYYDEAGGRLRLRKPGKGKKPLHHRGQGFCPWARRSPDGTEHSSAMPPCAARQARSPCPSG